MPRAIQRVAILHYASPPVVGGVESTIAYHARGLADAGYTVQVISGSGGDFDPQVKTCIHPLFGSKHPDVLAVKRELDAGIRSAAFETLVERQQTALRQTLEDCDLCIAHNVHTLNKNLPLTAALARLDQPRLIAWCHDLAWTNPQYLPELNDAYPWNLLRQPWPGTRYVTVSEMRQAELAQLLGITPERIAVVVPGIDPPRFWNWTATMQAIENRLHLLNADGLLLLPARLTRRKNIALALHVLAEIRLHSGRDFRLIVTGPPGPHNPANPGYFGELLDLRHALGLDDAAHFLYELADPPLIPDDSTMFNLYHLADALFFPSTQEGFGIPVLEAGLAGTPVFCSAIPALQSTGQADVHYFDPVADTAADIASRILQHLSASPVYRLRVRVRHDYRWDAIIQRKLLPLLEE
ncbi:MAG: glycosyltransferase family 4 protein [Chloroflexi bacterium]|nr:glycosyltransferase family 4 protein [Chloroflexota bacterium]